MSLGEPNQQTAWSIWKFCDEIWTQGWRRKNCGYTHVLLLESISCLEDEAEWTDPKGSPAVPQTALLGPHESCTSAVSLHLLWCRDLPMWLSLKSSHDIPRFQTSSTPRETLAPVFSCNQAYRLSCLFKSLLKWDLGSFPLSAFPWLPPCTPTTLAGALAAASRVWSHSQGWLCWHSSSDSVPYLPKKRWLLDIKTLILPHISFSCLLPAQQRGGCGSLFFPMTFFCAWKTCCIFTERTFRQLLPSPAFSILLPAQAAYSAWEYWLFLAFASLLIWGVCQISTFTRNAVSICTSLETKALPQTLGRKILKCDYTSLYLQPLEYEHIFFLPVFFQQTMREMRVHSCSLCLNMI